MLVLTLGAEYEAAAGQGENVTRSFHAEAVPAGFAFRGPHR